MTIIAAAVDRDSAWMRGDLAITDDDGHQVRGRSKVQRTAWGLLGFSGSIRVGQVVARELAALANLPGPPDLAQLIERALERAGWDRSVAGELPECEGLSLLLVHDGEILSVQQDLAILSHDGSPGYAIGAGAAVALGALHAAAAQGRTAKQRVAAAVNAACDLCASCLWPDRAIEAADHEPANL